MKRLLTLLLIAAMALTANVAFAAVASSPHDYLASTYGRCGICHVPHAAGGTARLWRVAPTGGLTGWAGSSVGKLCYGCHGNGYLFGGTISGNALDGSAPHTWTSAEGPFAATSHGSDVATLTGALSGGASGQPYISTGTMQCTSCHNVHYEGTFGSTDGNRPFLRYKSGQAAAYASLSDYCAGCHNDRLNSNTLGDANLSGNHPVNIAYASAGGGAYFKDPATGAFPAAMKHTVGLTAWSLGGKFNGPTVAPAMNTTIGCQTCHAVHNSMTTPATGTDQGTHLLAVNNAGDAADLCEGCHGNPTGNTARANSGAQMRVGATGDDHPIDCAIAAPGPQIDRWYVTAGDTTRQERHAANVYGTNATSWPRGATNGNIICTSCHSAHKGRVEGTPLKGKKLTRQGWANSATIGWCNACHSDASPLGHHTHSGNTGSAYGNTASLLDCASCHGGSGFGGAGSGSLAHNNFTFNANFAFSIPSNNASQLCNACHLGSATSPWGPNGNEVMGIQAVAALPADHIGEIAGGNQSGNKSHYLGTFADSVANSIQTKKTSWGAAFGGFSKYGAATDTHGASSDTSGTQLVCESCHSVLHNMGTDPAVASHTSGYTKNLLLQEFADDGHGATSTTTVGSGFCVACHNQTNVGNPVGPVADSVVEGAAAKTIVPAGTHPMTGWSVTRAADAGRATTTLVTGGGTYAAVGPGQGSYPGTDKMDCDSCHRVHNAPANSTFNQTKAGGAGNSRPVILETQAAVNEWSDFCQTCHSM